MGDSPLTTAEHVAANGLDAGDGLVLAQLVKRFGAGAPCEVEAFLYFTEPQAAGEVARVLGGDGYATTTNDAPIDGKWGVVARLVLAAHPLAIVALRRQMDALAVEHGGEYDGWGATAADANASGDLLDDARVRLRRYRPRSPFGWPLDRHERFARSIAKRPDASLLEVSASETDGWRLNVAKCWNWTAAIRDGDEEYEVGAYVQLALIPKVAVARERTNLSYWLREHEFLGKETLPRFPMPPELRRPAYHFLLNLKDDHGEDAGRYFGFERKDNARDARTWDLERFAQAAFALGHWQGAVARDEIALADPSLLRNPLQMLAADEISSRGLVGSEQVNALFAGLHRRPRTVCHNNISAVDLFSDPVDEAVTVLRDWQFVGCGPIGCDLAGLICQAPQSKRISMREFPALESRVLARYLEGLHAAGWTGDAQQISWTYWAAAALLFGSRAVGEHDSKLHRAIAAHARALGDAAFEQLR